MVVFVGRIGIIERIRERNLSCHAVLIHVTQVFVLQTVCSGDMLGYVGREIGF